MGKKPPTKKPAPARAPQAAPVTEQYVQMAATPSTSQAVHGVPVAGAPETDRRISAVEELGSKAAVAAYKAGVRTVKSLREGNWSLQGFNFVGGCLFVVASFMQLIFSGNHRILHLFTSCYLFSVGCFIMVFECPVDLPISGVRPVRWFRLLVDEWMKIIGRTVGRGGFYALMALLLYVASYASDGGIFIIAVCVYMLLSGIVTFAVGLVNTARLAKIRKEIRQHLEEGVNDKAASEWFDKFDEEGKGVITPQQFAALALELGFELKHNELKRIIESLDITRSNEITKDSFTRWVHGRFNSIV